MNRRGGQEGFSLIMLMAALTLMLIGMAAAVPSWRYVIQDDKEQELLSRGGQIADAIQAYQQKNGNALPTNLDVLVKGHFLRKAYKDPMTRDGVWRFIHQGEAVAPPSAPGILAPGTLRPSPSPTPAPFGSLGGTTSIGPFLGVASRSTKTSLRILNNAKTYDKWLFIAGQQRIVGKTPINAAPGAPGVPRTGAPGGGAPAGGAPQAPPAPPPPAPPAGPVTPSMP